MTLNHLDLAVPDVAIARDFFVAHLGFTCVETRGQNGLAILKDSLGLLLVLSRLQKEGPQTYPEGLHIGFHLPSDKDVVLLHERLAAAGVQVAAPRQLRGALGFYLTVPGGILVEIACRA